jgi:hypothetical protein
MGWFVDAPHLTVVETRRMRGNQRLLDAFIDDYSQRETKDAADMTVDELRASHQKLEAFLSQIGSGGVGTV